MYVHIYIYIDIIIIESGIIDKHLGVTQTPFTNKCARTIREPSTNKQPKHYTHAFTNRSRTTVHEHSVFSFETPGHSYNVTETQHVDVQHKASVQHLIYQHFRYIPQCMACKLTGMDATADRCQDPLALFLTTPFPWDPLSLGPP